MYLISCLILDLRSAASWSACSPYVLILFCNCIRWSWACLPSKETRFWYRGNFILKSWLYCFNSISAFLFSSMLFLRCSIANLSKSSLSRDCLASVKRLSFLIFPDKSFSHLSSTCFLFAFSLSNFACFSENLEQDYKVLVSTSCWETHNK